MKSPLFINFYCSSIITYNSNIWSVANNLTQFHRNRANIADFLEVHVVNMMWSCLRSHFLTLETFSSQLETLVVNAGLLSHCHGILGHFNITEPLLTLLVIPVFFLNLESQIFCCEKCLWTCAQVNLFHAKHSDLS